MASSRNLKIIAYNKLKSMILSNEIPQGSYLDEKTLCETMNMSRTPIREAINQLVQEDLVNIIQNKGIFVTEISILKVKEIFEMRHLIEPVVLEKAFPYLDVAKLEDFKDRSKVLLEKEDYAGLHDIDYEFHSYISACCPNAIMRKVADSLSDQFQRVRTLSFYSVERTRNGVQEHLHLIDTILAGNKEEAKDLLNKHIDTTENYFFRSL